MIKSSETKFGAVDINTPVKEVISSSGQSTYTITLKSELARERSGSYFFDNLIISGKDKDRVEYIARYEPTLEWLNNENRDFEPYSGKITFYDLDGSLINSINVENGTTKSDFSQNKVKCILEIKSTVILCVELSDADGPMGPTSCYKVNIYGFQCTVGGSPTGNEDTTDTNEPKQVDGNWTPPTMPLPEEITVQIKNELDNLCAKNIFSELRDGDLVDHSLSPEVQIPNQDPFNLEAKILKIFNEHKTIDYVIRDENNGNYTQAISGKIYTYLDDNYLNNASSLSIARTIIHESIHGYLILQNSNNQSNLYQALDTYAKNNGYTDANTIHHNFMGSYVDALTYSLFKWDEEYGTGGLRNIFGNIDEEYYRAMAFGGFYKFTNDVRVDYDAFKELVPDPVKRDKIVKIIKNEQDGNTSARGKKCL